NNHAHVVKAKPQISDNYFLCYMLNFINIEPFITGDARGKLSKSVLTTIPLPCPSLSEQKRIAETLRAIDRKIEHHENKKATLQDFFKVALNDLMKGGNSHV
ncbi:MAG: restriction endonuclease subunit S, partial [Candidatus Dadabacteria bacterium]|nr:restriction endonuclease subunit S [Candidatus Dadabacteria bacterium]